MHAYFDADGRLQRVVEMGEVDPSAELLAQEMEGWEVVQVPPDFETRIGCPMNLLVGNACLVAGDLVVDSETQLSDRYAEIASQEVAYQELSLASQLATIDFLRKEKARNGGTLHPIHRRLAEEATAELERLQSNAPTSEIPLGLVPASGKRESLIREDPE